MNKKSKTALFDALLLLPYAIGMTWGLFRAFWLPYNAFIATIWCLLFFVLFSLWWHNKYSIVGVLATVAAGIAVSLFIPPVREALRLDAFFISVADYFTGMWPLPGYYRIPLTVLLSALAGGLSFACVRKSRVVFWPLFWSAILLFLLLNALGGRDIIAPFLLTVAALAALWARYQITRIPKKNLPHTPMQLFALSVALFCMLSTAVFVPQNTLRFRSLPLEALWLDLNDYLSKYTGWSRPPKAQFSLASLGLEPLGDGRLGGPVATPADDAILRVKTNRRTLLRGAIRTEYTGLGWVNEATLDRYRFGNPLWDKKKADVFDLNFPTEDAKTVLGPIRLFQDTEIQVATRQRGTTTFFSPTRVTDIALDKATPILSYFNDKGETFSGNEVPAYTNYTVYAQLPQLEEIDKYIERVLYFTQYSEAEEQKYRQLVQQYTELPAMPDSVAELAETLAASEGAINEYRTAQVIASYLQRNYAYTLEPPIPPKNEDFVAYFLEQGEGYCTYFASATTVLARLCGIPARYVEGFRMPKYASSDGAYVITAENAHAWCEIYIRGVGWVPIDATPIAEEPPIPSGGAYETPSGPPEPTPTPLSTYDPIVIPGIDIEGEREPLIKLWMWVAMGALLLLLLALPVVLDYRRNLPSRIDPGGINNESRIRLYYKDLLYLLKGYGIYLKPGETPYMLSERVDSWLRNPADTMNGVTTLYLRTHFGRYRASEEDVLHMYAFYIEFKRSVVREMGLFGYYWHVCLRRPFQ